MFQKKNPIFVGHFYKRDLRTEEFYSIGRTMCANTHDYVYVRVYPYTHIYIYIYVYIHTHTRLLRRFSVQTLHIAYTHPTHLWSLVNRYPAKVGLLWQKLGSYAPET